MMIAHYGSVDKSTPISKTLECDQQESTPTMHVQEVIRALFYRVVTQKCTNQYQNLCPKSFSQYQFESG